MICVQNVFLPNIFQINGYISRKFCIDIGIAEELYGIASGLISFRHNRDQKQQSYEQSLTIDVSKNMLSPEIFRMDFLYTEG